MTDGRKRDIVIAALGVATTLCINLRKIQVHLCFSSNKHTKEQQCVPQCRSTRASRNPAGHGCERRGEHTAQLRKTCATDERQHTMRTRDAVLTRHSQVPVP